MRVDFILRIPGAHRITATEDMEAVPRAGDCVTLGGTVHFVHSVIWVPADKLVQVVVDP